MQDIEDNRVINPRHDIYDDVDNEGLLKQYVRTKQTTEMMTVTTAKNTVRTMPGIMALAPIPGIIPERLLLPMLIPWLPLIVMRPQVLINMTHATMMVGWASLYHMLTMKTVEGWLQECCRILMKP